MNRAITHQAGPVEVRRQSIQADIDARSSAAQRNRLGQFATPNALAVDIARYVESVVGHGKRSIRFGDPSIGSGSFFSAALAVFGSRRIKSAIGVELDPAFADAARNLWADAGLEVVCGDFTRLVARQHRDPVCRHASPLSPVAATTARLPSCAARSPGRGG